MAKVLLTGSTGFLGRHWLEALRSSPEFADIEPICLARSPDALRAEPWFAALQAQGDPITIVRGGLHDAQSWQDDPALAGVVAILHGAAEVKHSRRDTAAMFRTNVDGTLAMVRVAAHLGARLIFVSSSGTVGASPRPEDAPTEDAPFAHDVAGAWPYYASKIQAEEEAGRLARRLDVPLCIFRPPVLLGPGDHRFRSTGNIIRHLRGKLPFLLMGGMHFVDIRDAARAMLRAAVLPEPAPVYHLRGTACTVPEFFRMVESVSGVRAPTRILPTSVARRIGVLADAITHALPGDRHSPLPDPVVFEMGAHYWGLGSSLAERDLDYASRPPLETLRDTVEYLRTHHPLLDRRAGA